MGILLSYYTSVFHSTLLLSPELVLYSSYISTHTYTICTLYFISCGINASWPSGTLLAFLLSPGTLAHGLVFYSVYCACDSLTPPYHLKYPLVSFPCLVKILPS